MNAHKGQTIDKLTGPAHTRALAWGREWAKEGAVEEIGASSSSRGFQEVEIELEVDTANEPDGVAFYGPVDLEEVARRHQEIKRPIEAILIDSYAITAKIGFIAEVGNFYQAPKSMSAHVRVDPINEDGEIEPSWPYATELPLELNKAVVAIEEGLQALARQTAQEMLPIALKWLKGDAVVLRLSEAGIRFTKDGEPIEPEE